MHHPNDDILPPFPMPTMDLETLMRALKAHPDVAHAHIIMHDELRNMLEQSEHILPSDEVPDEAD